MATRKQRAPAPNIDGSELEILKVVGTLVLCTKDADGNITQEYQAGSIVLYPKHLPPKSDPVYGFEHVAREIQEGHETQQDALDRRLAELRARAAEAEPEATE